MLEISKHEEGAFEVKVGDRWGFKDLNGEVVAPSTKHALRTQPFKRNPWLQIK